MSDPEVDAMNEGMQRASRGAGPVWNALAKAEILKVAQERWPGTFTANDVRPRLPTPVQRKAMGSQFAALARKGLIVPMAVAFNNIEGGHKAKLWAWRITDAAMLSLGDACPEGVDCQPKEG